MLDEQKDFRNNLKDVYELCYKGICTHILTKYYDMHWEYSNNCVTAGWKNAPRKENHVSGKILDKKKRVSVGSVHFGAR